MGAKKGTNKPIKLDNGWYFVPRANKYYRKNKDQYVVIHRVDPNNQKYTQGKDWVVKIGPDFKDMSRRIPCWNFIRLKSAMKFVDEIAEPILGQIHLKKVDDLKEEFEAFTEWDEEAKRNCVIRQVAWQIPENDRPKTVKDWLMLEEAIAIKAFLEHTKEYALAELSRGSKRDALASALAARVTVQEIQKKNREMWKEKYGIVIEEDEYEDD